MRWPAFVVLLSALLLLAAAACDEGADALKELKYKLEEGNDAFVVGDESADVSNMALGQTAQIGDSQVTARAIRFSTDNPFGQLQPGQAYLVLVLSVKNTGKDTMNFFRERKLWVGEAWQGIPREPTLSAPRTVANSDALEGEIMAGASVTGEVAFIVSEAATGLDLTVWETVGDDRAAWNLRCDPSHPYRIGC